MPGVIYNGALPRVRRDGLGRFFENMGIMGGMGGMGRDSSHAETQGRRWVVGEDKRGRGKAPPSPWRYGAAGPVALGQLGAKQPLTPAPLPKGRGRRVPATTALTLNRTRERNGTKFLLAKAQDYGVFCGPVLHSQGCKRATNMLA